MSPPAALGSLERHDIVAEQLAARGGQPGGQSALAAAARCRKEPRAAVDDDSRGVQDWPAALFEPVADHR